ncbi:hypothetical protein [Ornithinibacillus halotolerans]|uniref:Uncharacterized protein n=1 Tax=Ornithinibacillus halotolerans TaxID=1274357 RepID=A0A916RZ59_9BACI|nr:hypothetical protein [Ornithinibacillus halotolerans]GGA76580.1 hypothetical protein GCM10008025_20230 [Ornithinibacillus halotolerans]
MMPFLYFPEDKSEYIPAVIMLVIIIVAAGVALYFIKKHSKKQEENFDAQYKAQLEKENKPN